MRAAVVEQGSCRLIIHARCDAVSSRNSPPPCPRLDGHRFRWKTILGPKERQRNDRIEKTCQHSAMKHTKQRKRAPPTHPSALAVPSYHHILVKHGLIEKTLSIPDAYEVFLKVGADPEVQKLLSLAKIENAFEMNDIQRGYVTCYIADIKISRSFWRTTGKVARSNATSGKSKATVRGRNLAVSIPQKARLAEIAGWIFVSSPKRRAHLPAIVLARRSFYTVDSVDQLRQDFWGGAACKCDTHKALDFSTFWFGTRRSMVQIHSPRPF